MMRAATLTACLMALLLTGCGATGRGTEYCVLARPIMVSRADVLTDGTARQILEANETWKRLCK